jgi:DUF971 family protein
MASNNPSTPVVPERLELIGDEVAVRWTDGHESYYRQDELRTHCPCAQCRAKRDTPVDRNPLRVIGPDEQRAAGAKIIGHEPVGRYAVQFHWSDRHDDGIYDFRMLRALCGCGSCGT